MDHKGTCEQWRPRSGGRCAGKPKANTLAGWFIVSKVLPPDARKLYRLIGTEGRGFEPPIKLDDEPWFPDYLSSQVNFKSGFHVIIDPVVAELERLASSRLSQPASTTASSAPVPSSPGAPVGCPLSSAMRSRNWAARSNSRLAAAASISPCSSSRYSCVT